MKKFKFFAVLMVFSLSIIGSAFLSLPFKNDKSVSTMSKVEAYDEKDTTQLPTVNVNQDNATVVFSAPWNYSEINLTSNIDMSGQILYAVENYSSYIFSGILNGNGYTISNLTFSNNNDSSGTNFGLIPYASEATIKDLRITGKVEYDFSTSNYSELNLGIIAGVAKNTTIQNCEIDISYQTTTEGANISSKDIALNFEKNSSHIGGIVGKIENSFMYDNIVKANFNLNLKSNLLYNVGGIVGSVSSSEMKRNLFFGNIDIVPYQTENNGNTDNQSTVVASEFNNVYCGGLIGFAQDNSTIVKDNAVSSAINSTIAVKGGIIGQVSANSSIQKENINFDYWTDETLQAICLNGEKFQDNSNLNAVSSISYSFLTDVSNFNPQGAGLNFKSVFGVKDSIIVLQKFQYFDFSINSKLDTIIDAGNLKFYADGSEIVSDSLKYNVEYGSNLKIVLPLQKQIKNGVEITNAVEYYTLSNILVNGLSQIGDDYQIAKKDNSFEISFVANGYTSGSYSFSFETNSYKGEFVVQKFEGDVLPGGISFNNQNVFEDRTQNYTIKSDQFFVYAIGQSYYVFDHWNLYYKENGNYILQDASNNQSWANVNNTNTNLAISFGVAPFNQEFKLEAVFSDKGGIYIEFLNFDEKTIESVSIQGNLFEGEPIKISNSLNNAELSIKTKSGFALNETKLIETLSTLYGYTIEEENFIKSTENEDGSFNYILDIDIAQIYDNGITDKIVISVPTQVLENGNGNSLLWLYISIPAVVVLGIAIFIIVYFKNRKKVKFNLKKKKEKEVSYKDFYY